MGAVGLLSFIAAVLSPWPASIILFCLGVLIAVVLVLLRPKESDLVAQAAEACDDPDLMTVWDVADVSDAPVKAIVLALERDGVPRADRHGWRARLPVAVDRIRYRRADVARWMSARQGKFKSRPTNGS